jgi:hypothetical protein
MKNKLSIFGMGFFILNKQDIDLLFIGWLVNSLVNTIIRSKERATKSPNKPPCGEGGRGEIWGIWSKKIAIIHHRYRVSRSI